MWFELIEKIIKYLILFLIGVLLFIVIHKVYKKCIDGFSIGAQPQISDTPSDTSFDEFKRNAILDDSSFDFKVNQPGVTWVNPSIAIDPDMNISPKNLQSAQSIFNYYNQTYDNNPFKPYFDRIEGILQNGLNSGPSGETMKFVSIDLDSFTYDLDIFGKTREDFDTKNKDEYYFFDEDIALILNIANGCSMFDLVFDDNAMHFCHKQNIEKLLRLLDITDIYLDVDSNIHTSLLTIIYLNKDLFDEPIINKICQLLAIRFFINMKTNIYSEKIMFKLLHGRYPNFSIRLNSCMLKDNTINNFYNQLLTRMDNYDEYADNDDMVEDAYEPKSKADFERLDTYFFTEEHCVKEIYYNSSGLEEIQIGNFFKYGGLISYPISYKYFSYKFLDELFSSETKNTPDITIQYIVPLDQSFNFKNTFGVYINKFNANNVVGNFITNTSTSKADLFSVLLSNCFGNNNFDFAMNITQMNFKILDTIYMDVYTPFHKIFNNYVKRNTSIYDSPEDVCASSHFSVVSINYRDIAESNVLYHFNMLGTDYLNYCINGALDKKLTFKTNIVDGFVVGGPATTNPVDGNVIAYFTRFTELLKIVRLGQIPPNFTKYLNKRENIMEYIGLNNNPPNNGFYAPEWLHLIEVCRRVRSGPRGRKQSLSDPGAQVVTQYVNDNTQQRYPGVQLGYIGDIIRSQDLMADVSIGWPKFDLSSWNQIANIIYDYNNLNVDNPIRIKFEELLELQLAQSNFMQSIAAGGGVGVTRPASPLQGLAGGGAAAGGGLAGGGQGLGILKQPNGDPKKLYIEMKQQFDDFLNDQLAGFVQERERIIQMGENIGINVVIDANGQVTDFTVIDNGALDNLIKQITYQATNQDGFTGEYDSTQGDTTKPQDWNWHDWINTQNMEDTYSNTAVDRNNMYTVNNLNTMVSNNFRNYLRSSDPTGANIRNFGQNVEQEVIGALGQVLETFDKLSGVSAWTTFKVPLFDPAKVGRVSIEQEFNDPQLDRNDLLGTCDSSFIDLLRGIQDFKAKSNNLKNMIQSYNAVVMSTSKILNGGMITDEYFRGIKLSSNTAISGNDNFRINMQTGQSENIGVSGGGAIANVGDVVIAVGGNIAGGGNIDTTAHAAIAGGDGGLSTYQRAIDFISTCICRCIFCNQLPQIRGMPDDAGYIAWLGNPLIQFAASSAMSLLLNILPQAALEITDFFNRFKVNAPFLITGAISKVVTSPGYLQRTILRMGQRFAPGTNIPIISDYTGLFEPSVYAYKVGDSPIKKAGKWFYRTVFLNDDEETVIHTIIDNVIQKMLEDIPGNNIQDKMQWLITNSGRQGDYEVFVGQNINYSKKVLEFFTENNIGFLSFHNIQKNYNSFEKVQISQILYRVLNHQNVRTKLPATSQNYEIYNDLFDTQIGSDKRLNYRYSPLTKKNVGIAPRFQGYYPNQLLSYGYNYARTLIPGIQDDFKNRIAHNLKISALGLIPKPLYPNAVLNQAFIKNYDPTDGNLEHMLQYVTGTAERVRHILDHKPTMFDVLLQDAAIIGANHLIFNHLFPRLNEIFNDDSSSSSGGGDVPVPPPTPPPTPPPNNCGGYTGCNQNNGEVLILNPENTECDAAGCNSDTCCVTYEPYAGKRGTKSNCNGICYSEESTCGDSGDLCNKLKIDNTTNYTLISGLYERNNTISNPTSPSNVNDCCKSNGENPYKGSKGCKWQGDDGQVYQCGCYDAPDDSEVSLPISNEYVTVDDEGNVTNTFTASFMKTIMDYTVNNLRRNLLKAELQLCPDPKNNNLEKCRDTSKKLTDYGYDGCIWNNYGPLTRPSD